MATKPLIFHVGSRKPFAEEAPVVDAVQQAKVKRGNVAGTALFKTSSRATAVGGVHVQAVDIVRAAAASPAGVATTGVVGRALAQGGVTAAQPARRSAIADARGSVAASLRRLGVLG